MATAHTHTDTPALAFSDPPSAQSHQHPKRPTVPCPAGLGLIGPLAACGPAVDLPALKLEACSTEDSPTELARFDDEPGGPLRAVRPW